MQLPYELLPRCKEEAPRPAHTHARKDWEIDLVRKHGFLPSRIIIETRGGRKAIQPEVGQAHGKVHAEPTAQLRHRKCSVAIANVAFVPTNLWYTSKARRSQLRI